MKKRVLAVTMAAVMTAAVLTACGADKGREAAEPVIQTTSTEEAAPAEETAPAEEEAPAEETAQAEETDTEMVSDETFAQLQDNFELMSECYDQVLDLYSSDEIQANDDIEEAMLLAAEVIDQMGEITQESITEEDAETLNEAMVDILEGLSDLVDGMVIENGLDTEMVSDETFAALQENYAAMTEAYNAVAEAYNSDAVAADADIEAAMNEAAEIIEQMGELEQEALTESDAEDLNEAMLGILEALEIIVNAMG